jgi:hypothetical protein
MKSRLSLLSCGLALAASLATAPAASAFGLLPGAEGFSAVAQAPGGAPELQAGSHPTALRLSVDFQQQGEVSAGDLEALSFELPPGLIENPTAVPRCGAAAFRTPRSSPFEASRSGEDCPDQSQVGLITIHSSVGGGETRSFGLFNLVPPPGVPAEIGARPYGAPVLFEPTVRQGQGEYGITLGTRNFTQLFDVYAIDLDIWGTPWSLLHNSQRGDCLNQAEPSFGWSKCSVGPPAQSPPRAYLTMPTSCDGPLTYRVLATAWQQSDAVTQGFEGQTPQGCEALPFDPAPFGQLSDPRASSPSGYEFTIQVPTAGITDPERLAASAVRGAVVRLPEGVTINPSVGAGLGVCTTAQYDAETPSSAAGAGCPNDSKIGDFTVVSPLYGETIDGSIFLAAPQQNPFGSLVAVYLVAKAPQRGILVKVAGELRADPAGGTLTAAFDRLPQLPYSSLRVHFREGQRSPLATPPSCGSLSSSIELSAWRDPGLVRHSEAPAAITAGAGGGPCPSGTPPFAPSAVGGTLNSNAGSYSPLYLHLDRQDPEQEITGYSTRLPPGLLGKIAGVPYCPEAAIAAAARRSGVAERDSPSCPAASRIGRTVSGYGLGPVLTYAPGGLFLAGPYHGSAFSVVAIDSALVGPFDLGVVIVRSAIRVDPQSAQVSIDAAGSDPIPHIIDGIPIHLRDVRAYIDRPNLTLNPTSCARFSVASSLNGSGARFSESADDSLALASSPFQAFNCAALVFKPRVSLALRGGTRRGRYPSLKVTVRPRVGDANIASAQVTLPPTEFLAQNHIKTICTRAQFAVHACPAGSVYGRARAYTPLLDEPLEGPVYLRSSNSALPDLVFALRGRGIEVDLAGKIDSVNGGLRGTFQGIPDAPVSKFEVLLQGGRHGALVNAANICAGPQLTTVRLVAHNQRGLLGRPRAMARCKKKTRQRHHKSGRGR